MLLASVSVGSARDVVDPYLDPAARVERAGAGDRDRDAEPRVDPLTRSDDESGDVMRGNVMVHEDQPVAELEIEFRREDRHLVSVRDPRRGAGWDDELVALALGDVPQTAGEDGDRDDQDSGEREDGTEKRPSGR